MSWLPTKIGYELETAVLNQYYLTNNELITISRGDCAKYKPEYYSDTEIYNNKFVKLSQEIIATCIPTHNEAYYDNLDLGSTTGVFLNKFNNNTHKFKYFLKITNVDKNSNEMHDLQQNLI